MASDKRTGAAGDGGAWARKLAEASARAADAKFGTNLRSHFAANETTYDDVVEQLRSSRLLGEDYELREVQRWTVHCAHCGTQLIGDTPKTDKAMQQLKNAVKGRSCRNPKCVSNGGTERRRKIDR